MKKLFLAFIVILFCWGQASIHATQMPEEVVGADEDEGYEIAQQDCYVIKDYVCMDYDPGNCWYGFYRFTSIPIAQGATIDACTLFVDVYSTDWDDPNITIHCEDTSSATTLVEELTCMSERNRTTASVAWEATGVGAGYQPSPELKTIVQEVVDRDDYSENNNLAFVFAVNDGSVFYTDAYEVSQPAKLHIWYTTGDGVDKPRKNIMSGGILR